MAKGQLFIISGPSGVGKGTIAKRILNELDNIVFSVSMTTRAPREGEVDGKNYCFVTPREFNDCIAKNGFLEYAEIFGNFYGTPRKQTLESLAEGKDVLLDIDIQGAINVKENYPDGVFIFILPPSMTELKRRITERGTESESAIELRFGKALSEMSYLDRYDYYVVNGELEEAVERVKAIFSAEHSRVGDESKKLLERYREEI